MDLAVTVGAVIVGGAALVILVLLPNREASPKPEIPPEHEQVPNEELPQGSGGH
jgi:hypothetical protein